MASNVRTPIELAFEHFANKDLQFKNQLLEYLQQVRDEQVKKVREGDQRVISLDELEIMLNSLLLAHLKTTQTRDAFVQFLPIDVDWGDILTGAYHELSFKTIQVGDDQNEVSQMPVIFFSHVKL